MPRVRYTADELLALQDSPLVKRPDNLPRIEQWLDQPTEGGQRKPRPQNGKGDESESVAKRPSLFESRQTRQSQSGEDIFLGPRMSFASAKDAHKSNPGTPLGDKYAATHESRSKFDRFGGKDKTSRDFEAREKDSDRSRGRFGQQNGHKDDETTGDGRPRQGNEYHDRNREQKDGGVPVEGNLNRRSGPPASKKFDQPWFREANKVEMKAEQELDGTPESRGGWRDRERERERKNDNWNRDGREQRVERDPQWMRESDQDNEAGHTMEDFAKWKASMKADRSISEEPPDEANSQTFGGPNSSHVDNPTTIATSTKENDVKPIADGPVFGIWGGPKRDTGKGGADPAITKANTTKPKSSRFATFFGPTQQPVAQAPVEVASPTAQPSRPLSSTAEDQQGFQRMLEMLRMGGTSSTGPAQQSIGQAPPDLPASEPVAAFEKHQKQMRSIDTNGSEMERPSKLTFEPPNVPLASSRRQESGGQPRPEPASRESEFLLKLMQQPQQPRQPFSEAQIYGQSYHRKDNGDMSTLLNNFAARPQESKSRVASPGFASNEHVFNRNGQLDLGHFAGQPQQSKGQHSTPMEEHYGGPKLPNHELRGYPPAPPFEVLPNFANARGGEQHTPNVPPGFTSRAGGPPGLPPFQQAQHQGHQHQTQIGSQHQPRGPMPSLQQPPAFFNGPPPPHMQGQTLPPGFHPHVMNGMPPTQQQRRPPMPVPMGQQPQPQLGFDVYQDAARRGMPSQMQGQLPYPHFLDQRGPGGY